MKEITKRKICPAAEFCRYSEKKVIETKLCGDNERYEKCEAHRVYEYALFGFSARGVFS